MVGFASDIHVFSGVLLPHESRLGTDLPVYAGVLLPDRASLVTDLHVFAGALHSEVVGLGTDLHAITRVPLPVDFCKSRKNAVFTVWILWELSITHFWHRFRESKILY